MSRGGPDFDELVGDGLAAEERERLERVHALLVAAGPPRELPPSLASPPAPPQASVIPFPRRYRAAAAGVAAALAVALLGAGYVIGRGTTPEEAFPVPTTPEEAFTVSMTGAGGARAELVVFAKDAAGNWPMELSVTGLEPLPAGKVYELWLTKKGELADSCGTFSVSAAETEVPLNAPYVLREYDGWVVVEHGSTAPVLSTANV
jgi:hypothetical protein